MSELQFDETVTQKVSIPKSESGLNSWLIKNGLASSESSANLILVVMSGLFILLSIFMFVRGESKQKEIISPRIFSPETTLEERRDIVKKLPKDQFRPLKEYNEN